MYKPRIRVTDGGDEVSAFWTPTLRLGIEALGCSSHRTSGLERYTQLVLTALSSAPSGELPEITLFVTNNDTADRLRSYYSGPITAIITSPDELSTAAHRVAIDVLHCTFVIPKYPPPCSVLITLHDVGWYTHARGHDDDAAGEYLRSMLRLLETSRSRVLTVSFASRTAITELLRCHAEDVEVARLFVLPAVNRPCVHVREQEKSWRHLHQDRPFYLVVGCYTPTKNVAAILQAFNLYRATSRDYETRLVVLGYRGRDTSVESLSRCVDGVIRIEDVSDTELSYLYRSCRRYLSASLVEGFGLPVLEAAASNALIACSNIPSHVEILANSGNYFDPNNMEEIAERMHDPTSVTPDYSHRLAEFTGQRMKEQLLVAYERALV